MRRIGAALVTLVSCSLVGCVVYVKDPGTSSLGWNAQSEASLHLVVSTRVATAPSADGSFEIGTWTGEGVFCEPPAYAQRLYSLEVRGDELAGGSRRLEVRSTDNLEGLPAEGHALDERAITLRTRRDAGVITFSGEKEGSKASGVVTLTPDAGYSSTVTAVARRPVTTGELVSLAWANIKREDVESVKSAGETASPRDLIRMREAGVSGAYLKEIHDAGQAATIDDAIRLRSAGVSSEYVAGLHDAGLSLSTDETIRMRNNGVSAGFVKALAGPDRSLPPTNEIVKLRNSGVSAQYIHDLRSAGYSLTTEEVIGLSNAGVSASYAKGMRDAGYSLTKNELIKLRNAGVTTQYVQDLQEPGYERMPIDQIIEARNKGLSAEFVKKLRKRS